MITPAKVRKRLNEIDKLLCEAQSLIEPLKDEMQEAYDEKSERWQEGDNGSAWMEKIEALEEADTDLQDIVSRVQGCIE